MFFALISVFTKNLTGDVSIDFIMDETPFTLHAPP